MIRDWKPEEDIQSSFAVTIRHVVGDTMDESDQKKMKPKKEKKAKERKAAAKSTKAEGVGKSQASGMMSGVSGKKQGFEWNPAKSVGIRLFLIFFITIVLFVVTLGQISYTMAKNIIQSNAADANQQTIIQTSDKLDIILSNYQNLSSYDSELQAMLTEYTAGGSDYDMFALEKKIREKLNNEITADSNIKAIYIIPPKKNKIFSAGIMSRSTEQITAEPWVEELLKEKKTMWLPTRTEADSPYFSMARSLGSMHDFSQVYIFVIELHADVLNRQLKGIDLGDGGRIQLLNPELKVVSSNETSELGEDSKWTFMSSENREGRSGSTVDEDPNGNDILAVYDDLNVNGWTVVGAIPTELLTKDAKRILFITNLAVVIVIVIAILIGMWMVHMIARPLGKLSMLMREGAKGNLNVRTDHQSKDEIGQLSASFNEMMGQITGLVRQTSSTAQDVLSTAVALSDASKKTALSAKEIAVATEEIANGASSLAVEAERGSDLTSNISDQMHVVVTANEEMSKAARHVESSSERGTKHLNDLLNRTHETEDMTRSMMKKVDGLKETTSSVVKVLEVLQNITKQTNILSLNATIEAARAGAAGRGFMVVADEIRQLADQSRQSIDMVSQITEKIMKEMNETVQVLLDANPLFKAQMDSVKETNEIFESVQQQMVDFIARLDSVTDSIDGLNQSQVVLSEAMGNVSAVAEESSATSEEVASLSSEQQSVSNQLVDLSEKLENVSNELKETLSRFTL
ncbi:methyl-accepting chemotaxis protein [Paenibacillus sp. F411]|uniref:methyl-accepting chemotaxis protein n=1 Tax=Paenibacillus sp. F411 TaxID=2820239 RepID=UPI003263FB8E